MRASFTLILSSILLNYSDSLSLKGNQWKIEQEHSLIACEDWKSMEHSF